MSDKGWSEEYVCVVICRLGDVSPPWSNFQVPKFIVVKVPRRLAMTGLASG